MHVKHQSPILATDPGACDIFYFILFDLILIQRQMSLYIFQHQNGTMAKPNFTQDDISILAVKLLDKLYESTEGDEWEVREIMYIYSRIEDGSYDLTNIPLRNNVIQHLLALEFISINSNRTSISITNMGKNYIYNDAQIN